MTLDLITRIGPNLFSTGPVSIGADTDASGTDGVSIQTRGLTRLLINNDGTAQFLKNDVLIGTFNGGNAGGRVRLATDSAAIYAGFWETTFDYTNGPVGETNYSNHTFALGYNSDFSGLKVVSSEVHFGLSHEPKFYSGTAFQTEIYYTWGDPTDTISIRPWGLVIQHTTGDNSFTMQGDINFFRNVATGGAQWGRWTDSGSLDLSYLSTAAVIFQNNIAGLKSKNAAGDNTIGLISVDGSNRVVVAPGGSAIRLAGPTSVGSLADIDTITGIADSDTGFQWFGSGVLGIQSNGAFIVAISPTKFELRKPLTWETDNTEDIGKQGGTNFRPRDAFIGRDVIAAGVYKVGTTQVVGAQGAAVADATDAATAITQLNALLARCRAHGLIST